MSGETLFAAMFIGVLLIALLLAASALVGVFVLARRLHGEGDTTLSDANSLLRKQLAEERDERRRRDAEFERKFRIQSQWIAMLSSQIVVMGGKPVTEHEAALALGIQSEPRERTAIAQWDALRRVLGARFTLGELRVLAADCGWRADEVVKDGAEPSAAAARMIEYALDRGHIERLMALTVRARPDVPEWTAKSRFD